MGIQGGVNNRIESPERARCAVLIRMAR